MTPYSLFLVALALAGSATAQYPNYFLPQTYSYANIPYSSGFTFPQYANSGAQYGYPMQMQVQQPFYGASPYMNGMGMDGSSTVMSAQTTTAMMPNPGVAMMGTTPVVGQAVISPQQIYQPGTVVSPVVTGQTVAPGTSVVQSNTVEVIEEQPQKNNGHFDYYAYGRDGLDSKEGRNNVQRRPYYQVSPPNYIRNGSPIRVTKPEHFEYVTYGRSGQPMTPYTP